MKPISPITIAHEPSGSFQHDESVYHHLLVTRVPVPLLRKDENNHDPKLTLCYSV